ARVFGNLMTLLTMLKGLPMAYNKDMQEDKEAVFDTFDTTRDCLRISATVLRNIKVREETAHNAALKGYLNATELADYLSKKDVPFRDAHELAGKIVLHAIEKKAELNELDLSEMRKFSVKIEADVYNALSLKKTLETKNTTGGTAPKQVKKALHKARRFLAGKTAG
ncbi:MAG: argininosuccinate lyase, partial [Acidobacteriota bacterium]|nr:argininosuccinate lyase [Acidobacteriota bacterium]